MKRSDLEKYLKSYGCQLYREGGRHSIWWNPANRKTTSAPRHREVNNYTVRGICRSLEIPEIRS